MSGKRGCFVRRHPIARKALRNVVEQLEARLVLSSISGTLWQDNNGNGLRDGGEPALPGWIVYLDQNRNHRRDAAELFATTGAGGEYGFAGLAAGTYYVAQELPLAWGQTHPGQAAGSPALAAAMAATPGDDGGAAPVQALTYTGSSAPVSAWDQPSDGIPSAMSDATSLINFDAARLDPRFSGLKGQGYSIAILDTGIDLNHPFFGPDANGNGIADRIVYQHDFYNNDSNASDDNSHGSNIASLIASQNSQFGGLAPGVNLIVLKVLGSNAVGSFAAVEQALQWITANLTAYNIAAVNMSFGDDGNWATSQQLYGISDELAAIAAQNVIVCAAAGNSFPGSGQQGVCYPAADASSLAVGAVYSADHGKQFWSGLAMDNTSGPDRLPAFTQRSSTLTDVLGAGTFNTGADSVGGTITRSGTSQASAFVAGVAVLAQQLAVQTIGRRLTMDEFRHFLRDSAEMILDGDDEDDNRPNTNTAFPRLDVLGLLSSIEALGSYAFGHVLSLATAQDITGADFGSRRLSVVPGVLDLLPGTDTGISAVDNLTQNNNFINRPMHLAVRGTFAGSTITIWANGGQLLGTATGTKDITFVQTSASSSLADGVHQITARQQIPGDSVSADSPALTVTIDLTPPSTPAIDLVAASDTGVSNTDNITSDVTPTFALTSSAPYFRIYRHATLISAEYATASSSFTAPPQPDGTYSFKLEASDAAGNNAFSLITVTLDTVAWSPAPPLDTSFGSGGMTVVAPTSESDSFQELARQPDGKIVAVGYIYTEPLGGAIYPRYMSIVRFNPDGSLDSSFGMQGEVSLAPQFANELYSVQILPDGKILAAGMSGTQISGFTYQPQMRLVRLNPNGSVDTSFGLGGYVAPPVVGGSETYQVLVTPAGKIIMAGGTASQGNFRAVLLQLSATGALEWLRLDDFGVPANASSHLGAILDPQGRIVTTSNSSGSTSGSLMVRYLSNGTRDTTFGVNGLLHVQYQGRDVNVGRPQFLSDGRFVAIGVISDTSMPNGIAGAVARFLPNGSGLDTTFGTGGVVQTSFEAGWAGLGIAPDGRIWVGGTNFNIPIIGRYSADGTPDTSLGAGGIYQFSGTGTINDLLLLPDGRVLVVGARNNAQGVGDRMIARINAVAPSPTPALDSASDSGSSASDQITRDTTPTINLSIPSGHYAHLRRDGAPIASYLSATSFTALVQPDGTSQWTTTIVDAAGNANDPSLPLAITVDTAAPVPQGAFQVDSQQRLSVTFNENVLQASQPAVQVQNLSDQTPIPINLSWGASSVNATFTGLLADGNYRATLLAGGVIDPAGNSVSLPYLLDFFVLAADPNRDRRVDVHDMNILASNWLGTGKTFSEGDFNYDGVVNKIDLGMMATRWHQQVDPPPRSIGAG